MEAEIRWEKVEEADCNGRSWIRWERAGSLGESVSKIQQQPTTAQSTKKWEAATGAWGGGGGAGRERRSHISTLPPKSAALSSFLPSFLLPFLLPLTEAAAQYAIAAARLLLSQPRHRLD
ncbi:hypothetical protein Drorol1_Dr00000507 [Drosera rotundifolia]